ncbi:hypothetical protein PR048_001109 [Dryococelus australis]|uniref:Uncharacterized protein n=1 Tax=Dryococelus australis TaxID=614101 RepID=A0ABQ9IGJ1_9NEOP|nr:hypothetical protein PR048_001109 [Dryococelus australis]
MQFVTLSGMLGSRNGLLCHCPTSYGPTLTCLFALVLLFCVPTGKMFFLAFTLDTLVRHTNTCFMFNPPPECDACGTPLLYGQALVTLLIFLTNYAVVHWSDLWVGGGDAVAAGSRHIDLFFWSHAQFGTAWIPRVRCSSRGDSTSGRRPNTLISINTCKPPRRAVQWTSSVAEARQSRVCVQPLCRSPRGAARRRYVQRRRRDGLKDKVTKASKVSLYREQPIHSLAVANTSWNRQSRIVYHTVGSSAGINRLFTIKGLCSCASKVKKRGNDMGDSYTHAWRLIALNAQGVQCFWQAVYDAISDAAPRSYHVRVVNRLASNGHVPTTIRPCFVEQDHEFPPSRPTVQRPSILPSSYEKHCTYFCSPVHSILPVSFSTGVSPLPSVGVLYGFSPSPLEVCCDWLTGYPYPLKGVLWLAEVFHLTKLSQGTFGDP